MKNILKTCLGNDPLICLLFVSVAQVLWNPLSAQQALDDEKYRGDIGVQHAECSFFTDAREKLLKSSVEGGRIAAAQRAAFTDHVVRALPKMSTKSLPVRSRAGSSRTLDAQGTIDEHIFGGLQSAGVTPATLSTDAEFLRRVTLDLTGRIPTAPEVTGFLADASPDKRAQAIERLLNAPRWADRWAMFFGDLFRNTTVTAQVNRYPDGRDAFHIYLRDSLLENKPYDQMAREILATSGTNDGRYYPAEFATYEDFVASVEDYEGNPVTATPASYLVGRTDSGRPNSRHIRHRGVQRGAGLSRDQPHGLHSVPRRRWPSRHAEPLGWTGETFRGLGSGRFLRRDAADSASPGAGPSRRRNRRAAAMVECG